MKYADWLKKNDRTSSAASATDYYAATGKDMPETLAAKINKSDKKQEYSQWASSKGGSNAYTGARYRAENGMGITDMQRTRMRNKVAESKGQMATKDIVRGDANVLSKDDSDLMKQAARLYSGKQQKKANSPLTKLKGKMG